jgi:hypothetical protein
MNRATIWRKLVDPVTPAPANAVADPAINAELDYRDLLARATEASATCWFDVPGGRPPLPPIERAGLIRLVESIGGSTRGAKIDAMIETMGHAPQGDIVEIGSWWGRSAALLVLLARRWRIGPVLCVDPWHAGSLDPDSGRMDADCAHTIFQVNLAPLAGGALNYLRATSIEAAAAYRPGLVVETETFGRTTYGGQIAYLHIDGAHAYEQATADVRAWTPRVAPGGWIVFDDYVWDQGDGPRRAGDEFLASDAGRVSLSFVIGTALFVRLKS